VWCGRQCVTSSLDWRNRVVIWNWQSAAIVSSVISVDLFHIDFFVQPRRHDDLDGSSLVCGAENATSSTNSFLENLLNRRSNRLNITFGPATVCNIHGSRMIVKCIMQGFGMIEANNTSRTKREYKSQCSFHQGPLLDYGDALAALTHLLPFIYHLFLLAHEDL